jgi:hypothetical protein
MLPPMVKEVRRGLEPITADTFIESQQIEPRSGLLVSVRGETRPPIDSGLDLCVGDQTHPLFQTSQATF